jgi:hypothetical protein
VDQSRSRFLTLSGAGAVASLAAACAGNSSLSPFGRSYPQANPEICFEGQPCATPNPSFKYKYTTATSGGMASAGYNNLTAITTSGSITAGTLYTGTSSAVLNSDSSTTYTHYMTPGGTSTSTGGGYTLPASIPTSGTFSYADSSGVTHTPTISSGSSTVISGSITDNQGNVWALTVTSVTGSSTYNCSWTCPSVGSYSTTFTLPSSISSINHGINGELVAMNVDRRRLFDGSAPVEIATLCSHVQQSAEIYGGVGVLLSVGTGLAVIGMGTPITWVGVGLMVGAGSIAVVGGALAAAHGFLC